jgi:4-aminobutyrate aminotransferase-like enzyme
MSHETPAPIQHAGESRSNDVRRRLAAVEPHSLRTYTPSLAVIARSAGSYHWTPEGRKLADFTSGVLVANLGHNPIGWWRRVFDYLGMSDLPNEGDYHEALPLTAYNAASEIELLASERLVANVRSHPGGARAEQVLWAASGSEAIQKALWAALARDKSRDVILATRGGFHGKKGLAGAVTGGENDKDRDPRVRFISFPTEECGSVQLCRQPLILTKYQNELDSLWDEFGSRLSCLITEPYLGGGGSFHPQKEYLQLLDRFSKAHGIVFILDEVQANFGRTGPMYAFSQYGVEPDIVVLGKGLGNGVPVSAAVGRADLFAALTYGEASDTWSGNTLSSAAVLATLDEFESTDVLSHAARLADVIEAGLVRLAETEVIERVRGEGLVWGIECAAVGERSAADVANACVEACYLGDLQGRAMHLLGPLAGKVIRVSPPLTMPLDEAREYLDAMFDILATLPRRLEKQPASA